MVYDDLFQSVKHFKMVAEVTADLKGAEAYIYLSIWASPSQSHAHCSHHVVEKAFDRAQ